MEEGEEPLTKKRCVLVVVRHILKVKIPKMWMGGVITMLPSIPPSAMKHTPNFASRSILLVLMCYGRRVV